VILESDPAEAAKSRAFLEGLGCEVVASVAYPGDVGTASFEATSLDALSESWVAASIAHDLNNAITALRAQLYVAHARCGEDLPLAECQQILDHCTTLAKRLLASARPRDRASAAAPPKVDLRHCVTDALRIVSPVLPGNIAVRPSLGKAPSFVCFHPELIIDAVVNLILNARDALPKGGSIGVSIAPFIGAYHQLTIVDSGIGMAPETLTSAFEPFFTTKGRESGTGLGLPAVRRTIEEAGGTVTISSEQGKGTEVTILLPRAPRGTHDGA
jgi:signal transduction histidine kinase